MAGMNIAIIGGTGPAGRGLAIRSAVAGHRVTIGSRDAERAQEVATGLLESNVTVAGSISGAANEDLGAGADLIVVATLGTERWRRFRRCVNNSKVALWSPW